jgi:peptidoglycan-associated lipoprotein
MRKLLAVSAVVLLFGLVGCAKQPATTTQSSAPSPTGMTGGSGGTGDTRQVGTRPGDAGRGMNQPGGRDASGRPIVDGFSGTAQLADIHFEFDKADIRQEDVKVLEANATWLKAHADQLLLIEGHCDERGTNEYNTALGDRRAKNTMNYLVSQGVAASRMTVISYGEERPACSQHSDDCWAKNRRAHFLVKGR